MAQTKRASTSSSTAAGSVPELALATQATSSTRGSGGAVLLTGSEDRPRPCVPGPSLPIASPRPVPTRSLTSLDV